MISSPLPTVQISGFSLIDLIITIVIASVLTAIAIPVYRNHTQRTHIADATSQLLIIKLQLEQYYQDNRRYGAIENESNCGITLPEQTNFSYSCTVNNAGQSYLLIANGLAGRGMQEFQFSLNEDGLQRTGRLPASWGLAPLNCWILKRGMTCL